MSWRPVCEQTMARQYKVFWSLRITGVIFCRVAWYRGSRHVLAGATGPDWADGLHDVQAGARGLQCRSLPATSACHRGGTPHLMCPATSRVDHQIFDPFYLLPSGVGLQDILTELVPQTQLRRPTSCCTTDSSAQELMQCHEGVVLPSKSLSPYCSIWPTCKSSHACALCSTSAALFICPSSICRKVVCICHPLIWDGAQDRGVSEKACLYNSRY